MSKKYKQYSCEICNYITKDKHDYSKHINTTKHKNNISNNVEEPTIYICLCGKQYKHASSLCKHKKTCLLENNNTLDSNVVIEEQEVCKCKDCVSKIDALENKIKELESKIYNQYEIIIQLSQKLLL